jgi:hypothetical protein
MDASGNGVAVWAGADSQGTEAMIASPYSALQDPAEACNRPSPPSTPPPLSAPSHATLTTAGIAVLRLRCVSASICKGRIELLDGKTTARLASARFAVAAHSQRVVRLHVPRGTRRQIRAHRPLVAELRIVLRRVGLPGLVIAHPLTLRFAP